MHIYKYKIVIEIFLKRGDPIANFYQYQDLQKKYVNKLFPYTMVPEPAIFLFYTFTLHTYKNTSYETNHYSLLISLTFYE